MHKKHSTWYHNFNTAPNFSRQAIADRFDCLVSIFFQDKLMKKGMVILREKIKNETGTCMLEV